MWIVIARENATPGNRDWVLSVEHRVSQVLTDKQMAVGAALAQSWLDKTKSQ